MPSSTEQELIEDIWEWDLDKCRLLCKMTKCCPENLYERVEDDKYEFNEGGVAHHSMRYYLVDYFKKLEKQNGKDES